MWLKPADLGLLPDLLAFLRAEGCIAYVAGDEIEAVAPHDFGEAERAAITALVNRWREKHDGVEVSLID